MYRFSDILALVRDCSLQRYTAEALQFKMAENFSFIGPFGSD